MEKIRVVYKAPNEPIKDIDIENSLEALQEIESKSTGTGKFKKVVLFMSPGYLEQIRQWSEEED